MSDHEPDIITEVEIEPADTGEDAAASSGTAIVRADEALPESLLLLPLSNRPLFPGLVAPLVYENPEIGKVLRALAEAGERHVGLVLVRDEEAPFGPENLHRVGVAARVAKAFEVEGQGIHVVVECLKRFRIEQFVTRESPIRVRASFHEERASRDDIELRAYMVAIINIVKEMLKHNPLHEEELRLFAQRVGVDEPSRLADFAASLTTAGREELQEVLETFPIIERMKKVLALLNRELNVSKVQSRIRKRIDERMSEQQRKFFLREQLQEIRRELGMEEDAREAEMARLKKRAAGLRMPDEARAAFEEELRKLSMLEPASPEYGVTRNWLDWITGLPWGKSARDRLDLARARRVLDRSHAGLSDIKQRILELIAVGARRGRVGGSIVLFVGPPGVGKTSIGRSIAEALGRPFYRFSVGGMRDEAEIKGHRRTYIGAMPGKIVQALKQTGVSNPVIMIDEVDKIGTDYRGDPASALLEALDPEQNADFLDHYLDVRFDLSDVLFLLTANQLDTIPAPLLDRAEIIRLPGYVTEEKIAIARRHLWPRQLAAHGLSGKEARITRAALARLVEAWAREPGVRRLEQLLKKALRKIAWGLQAGEMTPTVRVGVRNLAEFVGKPRFQDEALRTGVGLATGLAWTAMGGASLTLEAAVVHRDRRGLKVTGQLGKVMQESAEIAYSHVTANLERFGAPPDFFDSAFVHLHVPEGAVPKDGPSAGITMAAVLLSLALGRAPAPMAMTGELTLTGEVLAIGGVREKLLAAKRLGVREVILPKANRVDVEELPEGIADGLTIHHVARFDEVARLLFGVRGGER